MRRIRTGLAYGLVVALWYVAVRGSAAAWAPMEETLAGASIGWAARCGGQALDAPGYRLLDAAVGANWALNQRDPAALLVVAVPVVALFGLGFLVGLIRGPGQLGDSTGGVSAPSPHPFPTGMGSKGEGFPTLRSPDPPAEGPEAAAEARFGRSLAVIALALALAGAAAYGFVTGFGAVVVGLRARRHLPRGASGRRLAALAVAIGTLDALAWMAVLVTAWHPREAPII